MEESRERAKDEEKYTCEKLTKVDITIMEKVKNQRTSIQVHDSPEEEKQQQK